MVLTMSLPQASILLPIVLIVPWTVDWVEDGTLLMGAQTRVPVEELHRPRHLRQERTVMVRVPYVLRVVLVSIQSLTELSLAQATFIR